MTVSSGIRRSGRSSCSPTKRSPIRVSADRIWLYGIVLAIVDLAPLLLLPDFFAITANHEDWGNFWAAGATVGSKSLSDPRLHFDWQLAHHMRPQVFAYPPAAAWAYLPAAHLSQLSSLFVDQALMVGAALVCALLVARIYLFPVWFSVAAVFAWGPLLDSIVVGQSTPVALALVLIAVFGLWRNNETSAGLAIGVLLYKPSDAVVLIALLLIRRRWRALALTGSCAAVWYLASVAATAGQWTWPIAYVHMLQGSYHDDFAANAVKAFSLPTLLMYMKVPETYALSAALLLLACCLWMLARRPIAESANVAPLVTLAVSPHAWPYDAALLIPSLCYMMTSLGEPWRTRLAVAAYAIAVLPLLHFDPLAILVLGGTAFWIWSGFSRTGPLGQPHRLAVRK